MSIASEKEILTQNRIIGNAMMAELIRSYDWEKTSLGPIAQWPIGLVSILNTILQSPVPLVILWGKEGVMLYNDAYANVSGKRHPYLLGSNVVEGWPEAADFNQHVLDEVLKGETLTYKDQQFTLFRNNVPEEVWLDLNYSPIYDASGVILGVLAVVVETSGRVVAEYKQKLAEERYRNEQQRLNDIFKEAPSLILILQGSDHSVKLANPATLNLWGKKHRDVINTSLFEVLPELRGQGLKELLDDVLYSGQPYFGAERPVKLNNKGNGTMETYYLTFVYTPLKDLHGITEGVMVYANDVTEQVKARQIVEDQNQVLELATRGASIAEAMAYLIEKIENRSDGRMIGSVLLLHNDGKHLLHCAAPGLPESYARSINGIEIGPEVGSCGTAAYTRSVVIVSDIATDPLWKDFKELALSNGLRSCWSSPIISEGKVLGTFALYSRKCHKPDADDHRIIESASRTAALVIERKRMEDALRKSEEQLRALVAATSDIIYTMNADWSEMGPLHGQVFVPDVGRPRTDWLESNIPQSDQPLVKAAIAKAINGKSVFQMEHRVKMNDGSVGWVSSRAIPVLDENGQIIKWFGAATNINERKQAEEALNEKNKLLMRINNDLDNFIYTASHDLKAPISNLEGLFNTLLNEISLKEDLQVIRSMVESSFERFKNTIKDLTEITKVQKGEADDLEVITFSEILEEVKDTIGAQIEEHKVSIVCDFEIKDLHFSRKNIRSILYNLLSNAVKYCDPSRQTIINISTKASHNQVILTIADNGLGISASNQKKVFQMFKRFHNHVDGSGIGLYIVKRIIDNAGGKVELESEEGQGTTFRLYFPMR